MEARWVVGKVTPPEENGLSLSHWTFDVFTFQFSWKIEKKCFKSY